MTRCNSREVIQGIVNILMNCVECHKRGHDFGHCFGSSKWSVSSVFSFIYRPFLWNFKREYIVLDLTTWTRQEVPVKAFPRLNVPRRKSNQIGKWYKIDTIYFTNIHYTNCLDLRPPWRKHLLHRALTIHENNGSGIYSCCFFRRIKCPQCDAFNTSLPPFFILVNTHVTWGVIWLGN